MRSAPPAVPPYKRFIVVVVWTVILVSSLGAGIESVGITGHAGVGILRGKV